MTNLEVVVNNRRIFRNDLWNVLVKGKKCFSFALNEFKWPLGLYTCCWWYADGDAHDDEDNADDDDVVNEDDYDSDNGEDAVRSIWQCGAKQQYS